MFGFEMNWR
uniref:Uncharacterized protein n=1 Tax=Anguilla anguilla TaxID=7936 RepID=A0A0E9V8D1_ANGAN